MSGHRKKKVAVGVSGGVDSAVAAHLLTEQGHEVVGVTMCLGVAVEEGGKTKCCGPREVEDARRVCDMLGIRHFVMDFAPELEETVIAPFVSEYLEGRTPNPCVACNRHIKFGALLEKVLAMGLDALATGHYAGISEREGKPALVRSRDSRKDQTYFLHAIRREALDRILLPLADYRKNEVKEIARRLNLPVSDKQESQDICFIPKEGHGAFLAGRKGGLTPGDLVDCRGRVLGRHSGIAHYTIGQRARIGGLAEPVYVVNIDPERNRVVVGEKSSLKAFGLTADTINLLVDRIPDRAVAKIRYAHAGSACSVSMSGGELRVLFDEPQEAISPGQSVVLYSDGVVLGGGVIREKIEVKG